MFNDLSAEWLQKRKGGSSSDGDRHYEGLITDAASDGSIDYKNRPADKSKTGRWAGVAFIMGKQHGASSSSAQLVRFLSVQQ